MRRKISFPNRFPAPGLALLLPLVFVALLGAAPRRTDAQTATPGPDAFPLAAGTRWVYQAVVRWGREGSSEVD